MRTTIQRLLRLVNHPIAALTGIVATSLVLGIHLFHLVNEKAVNLIFWDQFDFYTPMFNHQGWVDLFFWQHGIHRQGLGGILTKVVADASGWNGRSEAFFILVLVYLTFGLVLLLRWRLSGRFFLADIILPIIVLNAYQYEIFIGTTNIAPAGLSLFLVFLYAVCWTIPKLTIRYVAVLVVNFVAIFTGYCMFLGIVTVFIFLIQLGKSLVYHDIDHIKSSSVAVLVSIFSEVIFFNGYQVYPSAGCNNFSVNDIMDYPKFIGLMLAKFVGLNYAELGRWAILIGLILLMFILVIGLWFLFDILRNSRAMKITSVIILALIGFTLFYCAGAAVGRYCLGYEQAQPSRYVTLLIPGYVGLFLGIMALPRPRLRIVFFAIMLLVVLHSVWPFPNSDLKIIHFYVDGKTEWKACYLRIENLQECNKETGFQVYPVSDQRIQNDLTFLKEHKYNLFLDLGTSDDPASSSK